MRRDGRIGVWNRNLSERLKAFPGLLLLPAFCLLNLGTLRSIAQSPSSGVSSHADHSHAHSHSHSHSHSDQEPHYIDLVPETPQFKEATDQLRSILLQMVDAELRFHNSGTPEEERRYRQQWYEIREQVWDRHRAMLFAALQEYLESPAERQKHADFLFGSLKRNVESDTYEGLLPIAKALYENQYPSPSMPGLYAMCCLAENEFELARGPLGQLAESGSAAPELVAIYEQLDELSASWQQELLVRQSDAAGEPLPQAKIETTKGTVVIELFENHAPEAVANFVWLSEQGFYNHKAFFLVVNNLLAQTGCPSGDGTGGPGYYVPADSETVPARHLFRGSVALNLLPDLPDSGGSQFMIAYLPISTLEKNARVFGRVISGMQNLSRLTRIDPTVKKKEGEPPQVPDNILSIEITSKRNHPYEPKRQRFPFPGDIPPSGPAKVESIQ